jgi:hypothetical protein
MIRSARAGPVLMSPKDTISSSWSANVSIIHTSVGISSTTRFRELGAPSGRRQSGSVITWLDCKRVEGLNRELFQGLQSNVRTLHAWIRGEIGIRYDDAEHSRCLCGQDAVGRIFERDAPLRRNPEPSRRRKVHRRMRLSLDFIVGRAHDLDVPADVEPLDARTENEPDGCTVGRGLLAGGGGRSVLPIPVLNRKTGCSSIAFGATPDWPCLKSKNPTPAICTLVFAARRGAATLLHRSRRRSQ